MLGMKAWDEDNAKVGKFTTRAVCRSKQKAGYKNRGIRSKSRTW